MKKVAILIHQYGSTIVGGAESYAKSLAEHLVDLCDVTVLTTTSNDYSTWGDYYKPGSEQMNGVNVIRFSAEKPRDKRFADLCNELAPRLDAGGESTYVEDMQWIDWEGPYCPNMVEFVKTHHDEYDAFIVITYIYYIAIKCMPEIYDRTIFIPTAHDETWIRLNILKDIFRMPRYFGFLTEEEQELVHTRFHNSYIPSEILGIGIDVNSVPDSDRFRQKFGIQDSYLIYVGRIDASKGCDELIHHFLQYKRECNSTLKLVMVGKGNMPIPKTPDIIVTGFVTEEEKYDAIAGAFAMVTPSKYESLCIALLEALALNVPVIANAQCSVLKGQCIRSNAGLFYENEREFGKIIQYLLTHPREYAQMGENGLAYVEQRYRWKQVVTKVLDIVERVSETNAQMNQCVKAVIPEKHKIIALTADTQIEPVWANAVTIVTSADKNYADFVGTMINSVICNASRDQNYDIIVLTSNIDDVSIRQIVSLIHGKNNFSIRFVYLSTVIQSLDIKLSGNYNEVTYFRLLIPQMMRKYEKIIYLDSDIVVNENIEDLWEIELGNTLLAATWDALATAWQTYDSGPQAYFEVLGLSTIGTYIQAGVIVIHIAEMNRTFSKNCLLEKACTQRYILADQDILNVLCKNRITYIEHSWNVRNFSREVWENCETLLPRYLFRQERKAVDAPKAIHYCEGSFPCWKENRMFEDNYWYYAWMTPFYDSIIKKKINKIEQQVASDGVTDVVGSAINASVDILDTIKYTDKVERNSDVLVLHPGGKTYGPNMVLGKGKHRVSLCCTTKHDNSFSLKVLAGAGHIVLHTASIHTGQNDSYFECGKNQIDVELIIENNIEEDMKITKLLLQ